MMSVSDPVLEAWISKIQTKEYIFKSLMLYSTLLWPTPVQYHVCNIKNYSFIILREKKKMILTRTEKTESIGPTLHNQETVQCSNIQLPNLFFGPN